MYLWEVFDHGAPAGEHLAPTIALHESGALIIFDQGSNNPPSTVYAKGSWTSIKRSDPK